jgi:hypothetical protein
VFVIASYQNQITVDLKIWGPRKNNLAGIYEGRNKLIDPGGIRSTILNLMCDISVV